MSLTVDDLRQIREICREENRALEGDVKDIYHIILGMQKQMDKMQQSMDEGLKLLGNQISSIARQAGAKLPAD
jgi:hypothetical protein